MTTPPPIHRFELNCFRTQPEFDVSRVQFVAIEMDSRAALGYRELRQLLHGVASVWHADGNHLFAIGPTREIESRLAAKEIEHHTSRPVSFRELLQERETTLRSLLYGALDQFMRSAGFMPSLGSRRHSYYPCFEAREDVTVTHTFLKPGLKVIGKNGVVFDLDLSPEGTALLWIDAKFFAFANGTAIPLETGDPIYLLCTEAHRCVSLTSFETILDGGFITERVSSADGDTSIVLPCASQSGETSVLVRTKSNGQTVLIPRTCAYKTVAAPELKDLGAYEWWRAKAMLPGAQRHELTHTLIGLIAAQSELLTIPLPGDQKIIFDLKPLTMAVRVRFAA